MTRDAWRVAPLTAADCDELGRVHLRVWREAYTGLMPADYLASLTGERFIAGWRARAAVDAAGATTLVARGADGRIVGFVSAGPSRDDDAPAPWELYAVNLLARTHGSGLADLLLERVLGDRDASLWVLEGNLRARAFYARHGFVDDAGRSTHEPTGATEVRMVRRRAAAGAGRA